MKNRATVLCVRANRILMVSRDGMRWSLPGGRIQHREAPDEAALRELQEETTLEAHALVPLFQISGLNTLHHVFLAQLEQEAIARPSQEIAECEWFDFSNVSALCASVPTRAIVHRYRFQPTPLQDLALMP